MPGHRPAIGAKSAGETLPFAAHAWFDRSGVFALWIVQCGSFFYCWRRQGEQNIRVPGAVQSERFIAVVSSKDSIKEMVRLMPRKVLPAPACCATFSCLACISSTMHLVVNAKAGRFEENRRSPIRLPCSGLRPVEFSK